MCPLNGPRGKETQALLSSCKDVPRGLMLSGLKKWGMHDMSGKEMGDPTPAL